MSDPPIHRELLTFALLGLWMWGSFSLLQSYGPTPLLIFGSVVMPAIIVLVLWGQRLDYLSVGDGWFTLGMENTGGDEASTGPDLPDDEQEKYR